jgi:hypothetical protein
MKRPLAVVALVMSLGAVALQAQTPAPKPGPEHKKLEIWVGDWTYEGDYHATPFGPAGKCTGKVSVRPILGGFFVEFRAEEKGAAGTTQYFEIDGYDPVARKYIWNGFDSQGLSETVTYTIEGNTVAYSGALVIGAKQAKSRGTFVFASDFMSHAAKYEISVDGKAWMRFFEGRFTKVKSSPK